MPSTEINQADADSRRASITLGLTLPTDVVLYLLLPIYAADFGVSLPEAGLLLAANRLVRIIGYGWVARFYARHGDRATCVLASWATVACAIGTALLSGVWLLLLIRLLWGMSFAGLNLATQALATAQPLGAARRSGRSRAFISLGPMIALPLSALVAQAFGPRWIFWGLAVAALLGVWVAHRLPARPHPVNLGPRGVRRPNSLDVWSFLEGFTLDGLFVIGLTYLGHLALPEAAVLAAGVMMAVRYVSEIMLSPLGGSLAERFGAIRVLLVFSLSTTLALIGFGLGWLWSSAAVIVVLRALQLPLLPPIVAMRTPGPERVQALASRAIWRDIGAGTGPLVAGLVLPVAPSWAIYGFPALLLAWAAIACARAPSGPSSSAPTSSNQ